jgi:hypothetical protein
MRVRQIYPLKPTEPAIRRTESTCWRRLCRPEVRSVVIVQQLQRHHIMATANTITCRSAEYQVGPISCSKLRSVELELTDREVCRSLLGSRVLKEIV